MKTRKVLVAGIDGATFGLVNTLIAKDVMPNLAQIVAGGCFRRMNSTIPEVSSTAWTTFMTGANPGRHGIFGFMDIERNSYRIYFPNSDSIRSETLWDILDKHNMKSIVINLPSTYPARKLNGILTAGFVAIDLRKATYPESAYEYLEKINYRMDVDTAKAAESLRSLFDDIILTLEKRIEAILHFLDYDWDLFIGTITETDRLHHFMWSAMHEGNEFHQDFLDFYSRIDEFLGEIYRKTRKKFGDSVDFLIVSDHGFTDIKQEVYVNSFLREKGYLTFNNFPPRSLEEIEPGSRVFALDPSRIYINSAGRFPRGHVNKVDYNELRKELKEKFLNLEHDAEKVINKVFFKEELYSGPCFDDAPDLVLLANQGYDLKGAINKEGIFGKGIFTGGHTREDAVFILHNMNMSKSVQEVVDIVDVAPTILNLLGIRDVELDGKALTNR
jgi:predicted AlkP superfamily phosphohydrolase/phosphomutase